MALVIEPFREEHENAVTEFNQRLQAGGAASDLVFFRRATPEWLPPLAGSGLFSEYFVAHSAGVVRGAYALKHQDFHFEDGTVQSVAYYHHPLSEGIINKAYSSLGVMLLRDAMARAPRLYCLGMGGYDRPLPQMLINLGWKHCPVPFYFKIVHAGRFLREMQTLRTSSARRFLMDVAASTGIGWMGLRIHEAMKTRRGSREAVEVHQVEQLSNETDALWQEAKAQYAFIAVRDGNVLQRLYPAECGHLTKLQIRRAGRLIGWAVVGERRKDVKYGNMRVGSVVDCWAVPEGTLAVIRAATDALVSSGMDLIVSNQLHGMWQRAFEGCGYMQGPSNFLFAVNKELSARLQPFEEKKSRIHMTRADGDGLPRNY